MQKKIWNVPLHALMCPLQIINDIEPLSLTIHGLIGRFIHHPSNVKITRAAISQKPIDQIKKKNKPFLITYFYTLKNIYG